MSPRKTIPKINSNAAFILDKILQQQFQRKTSFLFLIMIKKYHPHLLSAKKLAIIIHWLVKMEKNPGGPYYNEELQLDLVLNRHIAYFLSLLNIQLKPLNIYLGKTEPAKTARGPKNHKRITEKIYEQIERATRCEISKWPKPLAEVGLREIDKIYRSQSGHEVALVSLYSLHLFSSKINETEKKLIINLGQANSLIWLAYNIYDDILDDNYNIKLLPLANSAMQKANAFLSGLNHKSDWKNFLAKLWLNLENYNYLETLINKQSQAKALSISRLHLKSLAHAIGPLALAYKNTGSTKSGDFRAVLNFFRHYLNARQLADDLADWPEDLRRGKLNSVSVRLLNCLPTKGQIEKRIEYFKTKFYPHEFLNCNQKLLKEISLAKAQLLRFKPRQTKHLNDLLNNLKPKPINNYAKLGNLRSFIKNYKKIAQLDIINA